MDKLDKLDQKIAEYKNKHKIKKELQTKFQGAAGFVVSELVAAIFVGSFIGYYLDKFFGTKILFLMIFIILGLVSSIYNIYNRYK